MNRDSSISERSASKEAGKCNHVRAVAQAVAHLTEASYFDVVLA